MNDNITLPHSVVEHVMYHLNRGDADAVCWADGVIKPALEQPQRKLTPQDIADSALLGNIESPFNACMHQEHCKRWKAQADQQHQGELSSDNDLQCENSHLITTSSSVPFGYKLVPVEPTQEMLRSAFPASGPVTANAVYRAMLAAAPQPPVAEQPTGGAREAFEAWCHLAGLMQQSHGIVSISSHTDTAWLAWQAAIANRQQPQDEQEPVAWLHTDRLGGKHAFTSEPPPGLKAQCQPLVCATQEKGEQGPVATVSIEVTGSTTKVDIEWGDLMPQLPAGSYDLYTHPHPQREPLTDEAKAVIDAARAAMDESTESYNGRGDISIASELAAALSLRLDEYDRAIERAHGIGGEA